MNICLFIYNSILVAIALLFLEFLYEKLCELREIHSPDRHADFMDLISLALDERPQRGCLAMGMREEDCTIEKDIARLKGQATPQPLPCKVSSKVTIGEENGGGKGKILHGARTGNSKQAVNQYCSAIF